MKKYGHDISATKTFYQQTISQKATFNILIPISQNEIYEPRASHAAITCINDI